MSKEEIVICIDNSEYMRNGDYTPSRMDAQQETANVICGAKTGQHPETTLAVVSLAGKTPTVQVALTNDLGKLLATLSSTPISGTLNLTTGIKVSELALKRKSSDQGNAQKRIIAFIGSPIKETKEELVALGTELQKFNIALDVVNFGEEEKNTEKLEAFVAAANSENNSRLVTVPQGPHILSDMILKSPIVLGNERAAEVAAQGTNNQFEFGVDPSIDPELAMALKLSMEEENKRQQRAQQQQGASTSAPTQQPPAQQAPQQPAQTTDDDIDMDDEDAINKAIAMSLLPENQQRSDAPQKMDAMEEEDEDLKLALELSKQNNKQEDMSDVLQDDKFLNDVVSSLGANPDEVLKKKKEDEDKKK